MLAKCFLPLLLATLLLAACSSGEEPLYRLYENQAARVRFHPAKGWDVREIAEDGCDFAVEASKGPELRFVICSGKPRPELLLTSNTYVSCENLKEYVVKKLKGIRPECRAGGAGPHFGLDTIYARLLGGGEGLRVQFVNQLFIPERGRLVQVMSMAVGKDDAAAQALFDANRSAFFAMMGSVRLR